MFVDWVDEEGKARPMERKSKFWPRRAHVLHNIHGHLHENCASSLTVYKYSPGFLNITNFNLRNVGYQFNFPVRKNFLFERKFIRVLNLISDKRDMSTKRLRFMPRTLRPIRTSLALIHICKHIGKCKHFATTVAATNDIY